MTPARLTCPACEGHRRAYVATDGQVVYHGEPCYLCKATGRVTKAQAAAYAAYRPIALASADPVWRLKRGPLKALQLELGITRASIKNIRKGRTWRE